jgi:hypothetical protein
MSQTFAAIPIRQNGQDVDAGWWEILRQAGANLESINGALSVVGTRASPTAITAVGGISPGAAPRTLMFVQGSGGAVDLTANPQIAAGISVGQELVLRTPTGGNGILLEDGTGLSMNGPANMGVDCAAITFIWDGTEWFESGRSSL